MSEVLLKWQEPSSWHVSNSYFLRVLRWWPLFVFVLIGCSLYYQQYGSLPYLIMGFIFGILDQPPRHAITSKGISVGDSCLTNEFFRWDDIEWYEIESKFNQPDWLQIMLKVRRRKRTRFVTLHFPRHQQDESTLLRILGDYLVDKDARQLPRPEKYQELAQ